MNDFDTLYASAGLPVMEIMFGETVTYTHGATVTACTAELTPIETAEEDGERGTIGIQTRQATVSKTDVPSPSENATMTIGSTDWAVKRILLNSDSIVILDLVLIGAAEISPPGYRKQQ